MKLAALRPLVAVLALSLSAGGLLGSCGRKDKGPTAPVEKTYALSDDEGEVLEISRKLPREVHIGKEIEYRTRVRNVSKKAVAGVVLREGLPQGFEVLDARVVRGDDEGDEGTRKAVRGGGRPVEAGAPIGEEGAIVEEGGELVLRLGRLDPDERATMVVRGIARIEGELQSHTKVTYEARLDTTWNIVRPELRLDLLVAEEAYWICDDIALTHRLENTGTGTATKGQIRTRLPQGLRTADGQAELVLEFDELEPGEIHEEAGQVRAERPGDFEAQAIAVTEGLEVRSQARLLRVIEPRLELEIGQVGQVSARTARRIEVMLSNRGPVAIENIQLRIEQAEGIDAMLVRSEPDADGDEKLELARLAPGERRALTLALSPGEEGGPFEVVIRATAHCLEEERALRERITGTILGVAALRVEFVDETDPVAVGQMTRYRIEVKNQGSATDRGIELALHLSPELEFVEGEGAGAVHFDGKLVRFAPLDALEPGDTAQWHVQVRGAAPGRGLAAIQVRSRANPDPVRAEEPTTVVE